MGGAISIQQKETIETSYKEQVQKLEANIAQVNQKIEELTVIKDQFADIATPAPVKSKSNNLNTK
jgi:prefoldin subunit 5